jgi:hypothetical protein
LTCRLHALLTELQDLLGAVLVINSCAAGQTASKLLGNSLQQLQSTACPSQLQDSACKQTCSQAHRASAAIQQSQETTGCLEIGNGHAGSCEQQQSLDPRSKPVLELQMPRKETAAADEQRSAAAESESAAAALQPVCPHYSGTASAKQQHSQQQLQQTPQQQQQQQHVPQAPQQLPSPLMLSTKLFKPCLADVVMHVRAASQAQVRQQQSLAGTTKTIKMQTFGQPFSRSL